MADNLINIDSLRDMAKIAGYNLVRIRVPKKSAGRASHGDGDGRSLRQVRRTGGQCLGVYGVDSRAAQVPVQGHSGGGRQDPLPQHPVGQDLSDGGRALLRDGSLRLSTSRAGRCWPPHRDRGHAGPADSSGRCPDLRGGQRWAHRSTPPSRYSCRW